MLKETQYWRMKQMKLNSSSGGCCITSKTVKEDEKMGGKNWKRKIEISELNVRMLYCGEEIEEEKREKVKKN